MSKIRTDFIVPGLRYFCHCQRPKGVIASPVIARRPKTDEAISKTGSQQTPQSLRAGLLQPLTQSVKGFAMTHDAIRNTHNGFTLLELLIVSSIIAIIALALFSTFSMGIRAYKRMHYSGLAQADVLLSLEKLEKDLHNTLNFSGIGFIGENKRVSFAGLAGPQANSTLGRVSYYLDTKKLSLVKEESAYSQDSPTSKTLASIKDIAFTYYYFDPQTREYVWQDSINKIPLGVKIKIIFKGEDEKDIEITRTILIPISG